jgi:hypothetical protein
MEEYIYQFKQGLKGKNNFCIIQTMKEWNVIWINNDDQTENKDVDSEWG